MPQCLQLFIVAHQVEPHPLVADLPLAIGEFALEQAARGSRLLVFLGESIQFGLRSFDLAAELFDAFRDRRQ